MKEEKFFPGGSRRVLLGSPTLQTSNGRICLPIIMPLSSEPLVGMPDWVGEAYTAVSKHFSQVDPEIEQIADLTLHFSNDKPTGELFAPPSAKIPTGELKKFSVIRAGNPEDPKVELHFKMYAPFAREFWRWIGEMAGKEVFMSFPKSLGEGIAVVSPDAQTNLLDQDPTAAETEALAGDANPANTPGTPEYEKAVRAAIKANPGAEPGRPLKANKPGSKSGPKELAAYHAKQVQ